MRRAWVVVLIASLSTGCELQKLLNPARLFPEKVAMGAARLTVRNAATLMSLVDVDTGCGFASTAVKEGFTVEGEVGLEGSVTWTVSGCTLDFGAVHEVRKNCSGQGTLVGGKAVVDATKTVRGRLTGNPLSPVIPAGNDAATVRVSARLQDFEVRLSDKDTALINHKGTLSFIAVPHLAVSASKGVCAVSTPDMTLSELAYDDAVLTVESESGPTEVDVSRALLQAQLGRWGDQENTLTGDITVWGQKFSVPVKDDKDGLDPDYERGAFVDSFSCKEDLDLPLTYECRSQLPQLSQGVARLALSNFGNLVSLVNADTTCGFSSGPVLQAVQLQGALGEGGASATYSISSPCVLTFPQPTPISTDCHGVTRYVQGAVSVTGTKTLRGIRTGSPSTPIVPTSSTPATIEINASLDGLVFTESDSDRSLTHVTGSVSGTATPATGLDTTTGACSIPTPVVQFDDVTYTDSDVVLQSAGNTFKLRLDTSDLDAQSGTRGTRSNTLTGIIQVEGVSQGLPLTGEEPLLDPEYDPAAYLASYACTPNLTVITDEAECSFTRTLAEGASRLIIQTAGTLASMINKDSSCGFENALLQVAPDEVQGDPGEMGWMIWSVEECELEYSDDVYQEDCLGGVTRADGRAVVDAVRTVTGEREKKLLVIDSIIPRTRDAVTVDLGPVELHDFVVTLVESGTSGPAGTLTIHSGTLEAEVRPVLGERQDTHAVYDIPTPIARLSGVKLRDATATLRSGDKTFKLQIGDSNLSALNGGYMGRRNWVRGDILLGSERVDIPEMPLKPNYSQLYFDETYACTEELREPVPAD